MQFENLGSLITVAGTNNCLGYLMNFTGHGVFDANYGKVDISPEHVEAHNKALDEAMLKGLDENCNVGQYGTFYLDEKNRTIKTFLGRLVSDNVKINGRSVTFHRAGKKYRGRSSTQHDLFNFRRVA